jgi:hypothetical protein
MAVTARDTELSGRPTVVQMTGEGPMQREARGREAEKLAAAAAEAPHGQQGMTGRWGVAWSFRCGSKMLVGRTVAMDCKSQGVEKKTTWLQEGSGNGVRK